MEKKYITELKKLIYNSDKLKIWKDNELCYIFDIDKKLYTNDILEALSYLIKNKKWDLIDKIKNLEITEAMINFVRPINSIYWLSGGDVFWNDFDFKWSDNYEIYEKKFERKLYRLLEEAENLITLKNEIIKHFNIDVFYEFVLLTKIKKDNL